MSIFHLQKRRKPLGCQPRTVEAFIMKTPDCPDPTELSQESIRGREFRPLHGALKDSELVVQRENLQLERSTAPKRGGK
jgi:hypothetical protein